MSDEQDPAATTPAIEPPAAPSPGAPADPAAPADAGAEQGDPVDTAAQAAADAKAQAEGYIDAAAKDDAETAAKAKPKKPKAAKAASPPSAQEVAIANARGLDAAREGIAAGQGDQLLVGFGDANRPFRDIPLMAGAMRIVGPRIVTGADIVMRTGKLTGAVHVTHAWLIGSPDTVLARVELGAPMVVSPGQQIKIAAGRLAFN